MRRSRFSLFSVAGLALGLAAAGCGSSDSDSVTGSTEVPMVGIAVVQGTVVGASSTAAPVGASSTATHGDGLSALSGDDGLTVRVEGTNVSTSVDEDGGFILSGLPAGTVTLVFEGSGASARLTVSGLLDGQVLSLQVQLSGGHATIASQEPCTPTKQIKHTGKLDSMKGTQLVVGGRPVDASENRKVWRGWGRIQLDHLDVGEKVRVWGTLRGDGVIVAEEIEAVDARGNDQPKKKFVRFKGKVQSIGFRALDVHANPNSSHPTLVVAGRTVKTSSGTKFKWSDKTGLNPGDIRVGDKAYVEGWQKNGVVDAKKVVVDCR
jgi:hypothetical protein